jgi:hypothetical protein
MYLMSKTQFMDTAAQLEDTGHLRLARTKKMGRMDMEAPAPAQSPGPDMAAVGAPKKTAMGPGPSVRQRGPGMAAVGAGHK